MDTIKYDALECKRTLCFHQGQPEDEETDDIDVDIMVRTTATGTQDTTVHQENTQLDNTNRTSSERLQGSPERQHQPLMMTREESMLPREACDALEHKRTLRFNQGQPEDEETDDKDVDIMVRTTITGTQDTTVCQENTQLDKQTVSPVKPHYFTTLGIFPSFHLVGEVSLLSSMTMTLYGVSVTITLSVT